MIETGKTHSGKGILLILFLLLLSGAAVWLINTSLKNKKIDLEKSLASMKSEFSFAEIKVIHKTNDKIRFNLRLLSIEGGSILEKSYELAGNDIFIESKVVVIEIHGDKKSFVFPYSLYTDRIPPQKGESLIKFYTEGGFPQIYKTAQADESYTFTIQKIFNYAFNDDEEQTGFGMGENSLKMDISLHQGDFHSFEENLTYRCTVHPNGGLELTEVK